MAHRLRLRRSYATLTGPVTIFNIGGNKYRLITAIRYNTQQVYAMLVLTHHDYNRMNWKDHL